MTNNNSNGRETSGVANQSTTGGIELYAPYTQDRPTNEVEEYQRGWYGRIPHQQQAIRLGIVSTGEVNIQGVFLKGCGIARYHITNGMI
jgi:hypothetical protein